MLRLFMVDRNLLAFSVCQKFHHFGHSVVFESFESLHLLIFNGTALFQAFTATYSATSDKKLQSQKKVGFVTVDTVSSSSEDELSYSSKLASSFSWTPRMHRRN